MMNQLHVKSLLQVLAQNVKMRRSVLAITQEQLAELAGLSHNYVARIELGMRQPSIATLAALADALDTDVAALFARESPREESIVRTHYVDAVIAALNPEDRDLVTEMLTILVRRLRVGD